MGNVAPILFVHFLVKGELARMFRIIHCEIIDTIITPNMHIDLLGFHSVLITSPSEIIGLMFIGTIEMKENLG
jgi:hypothetical protein